MIYLASPYSGTRAQEHERFRAACHCAAWLMRQGYRVLSPIVHSHPLTRYGLPGDWEYWSEYDCKILRMCSSLYVLRISGWDKSVGVQNEISMAEDLNIECRYLMPKANRYVFVNHQNLAWREA